MAGLVSQNQRTYYHMITVAVKEEWEELGVGWRRRRDERCGRMTTLKVASGT